MSDKVTKLEIKEGGKDKEAKFKKGDWIIATEPLLVPETNLFAMGTSLRKDRQFMDKPVKVLAVTEQHIVYEWKSWDKQKMKSIIPMYEVNERKFIIADKVLVDVIND